MASVEPESEDLAALLEGSDEEEEAGAPKMLDLNGLNSISGMATSALSKNNPILLDMLDLNEFDEEEEKDLLYDKSKVEDDLEVAVKREKLIKIMSGTPPGINLFPTPCGAEIGFQYFTLESLNLEKDFGYGRRGILLGHGLQKEKIDALMSDHQQFLYSLHPEAQSVLICDGKDFKAVMNFLFYSISVCTDRRMSDLMVKALFDLRRNYAFRWDLNLQHIFTVLLNYGVDRNAVYNEKFYNKLNVGIRHHLEMVIKSGQKVDPKYKLPKPHNFLKRRMESKEESSVSSSDFHFCYQRFIEMVCQWSAGFPSHLDLKHKNQWADQLVFMHLLLLMGTDQRVVGKSSVVANIREALHVQLDSFSAEQWHWGPLSPPRTPPGSEENNRGKFNHHHPHKSLVRLVNEFFPGELCPAVINWSAREAEEKVTDYHGRSDHHLNMVYRISLVPDSYRGNQLRKYLAFMYLQTLADLDHFSLPEKVDVTELTQTVDLCESLSSGIKLIVRSGNSLMTATILELYDIIVGCERDVDFTKEKIEHINLLRHHVPGWIQRKMPGAGQCLDINNEKSIKAILLREYVDVVENRWKLYSE